MTQRDAILVLVSVVLATGIGAMLLVGTISATGERRQQFVFQGGRGVPPGRVVDVQRLPPPIRPIAPIEREVAEAARGAAGYLLVLLAVAATIVLAREQVLTSYRVALGDLRTQARTLGTGVAVLLLIGSALFLSAVTFLGALTGGPLSGGGQTPGIPSFGLQFGLQAGFIVLSVILVLVALPALIGFAASAWRLGDAVLGIRLISRWGSQIPAPLVALIGATLIYLAAQVPYLGIVVGGGALAYGLGAFVTARLDMRSASGGA